MLTIGWDLDGVLYPWHSIVLEYCKINKLIPPETTMKEMWGSPGIFNDQFNHILRANLVNIPTFYGSAVPSPTVMSVLQELDKFTKMVYITRRPIPEAVTVTRQWVKQLPQGKNIYISAGSKTALVKWQNCDIYVEDRIDSAKELELITSLLLLTRSWNEGWQDPGITRIYSLWDVIDYVDYFGQSTKGS